MSDVLIRGACTMQLEFEEPFKGKAGKSMFATYLEMWSRIIRSADAADLLFDGCLVDTVSHIVIALSW